MFVYSNISMLFYFVFTIHGIYKVFQFHNHLTYIICEIPNQITPKAI